MKKSLNTKNWEQLEAIYKLSEQYSFNLTKEEMSELELSLEPSDPYPYASYASNQKGIQNITEQEWLEISLYLSQDLSDTKKNQIFDFIAMVLIFDEIENKITIPTTAQLRKEITVFKEVVYALIPQGELEVIQHISTYTPKEDELNTIKNAYEILSSEARTLIKQSFFLACRIKSLEFFTESIYPSQYYCVATVALERLPKSKRGNLKKDETGLYRWLFSLWESLGETEFEVTYNQEYEYPQISKLVGFTHTIFKIINNRAHKNLKALDTIRKDLAKYKKLIFGKVNSVPSLTATRLRRS